VSEMNKVDKLITNLMLKAKKNRCSTSHDTEWSIALHQQSLICQYWLRMSKGLVYGIKTQQQILKLYDQLPEETKRKIDNVTRDKCNLKLHKIATKEFQKTKELKTEYIKHHVEFRAKGMQQLAEIRQREGNQEAA
jgi:hypothetical protein